MFGSISLYSIPERETTMLGPLMKHVHIKRKWLFPALTFGMFFLIMLSAGCLDSVEYLTINHVSDTPPAKGEIVPFTSEDLLRYPAMEGMPYRVSISDNPLLHISGSSHLTKADANEIFAKYGEPFGKVLEWNHSYYKVSYTVS